MCRYTRFYEKYNLSTITTCKRHYHLIWYLLQHSSRPSHFHLWWQEQQRIANHCNKSTTHNTKSRTNNIFTYERRSNASAPPVGCLAGLDALVAWTFAGATLLVTTAEGSKLNISTSNAAGPAFALPLETVWGFVACYNRPHHHPFIQQHKIIPLPLELSSC